MNKKVFLVERCKMNHQKVKFAIFYELNFSISIYRGLGLNLLQKIHDVPVLYQKVKIAPKNVLTVCMRNNFLGQLLQHLEWKIKEAGCIE